MRFGSVCSGIEAASVAWHPLGWKAAWLSEIEPFPSAVLAHHYPDAPNLGDMTRLPWRIASGEIEAPDVFCGGTPCQAFSVAGLRRSLDDARGNLSLTFCEIANEIDKRRMDAGLVPCIVFWENVPGVLNTKDNAFGCFLAGLAGEDGELEPPGGKWPNAGAVYGPSRAVAWRVLDAQYFGVAQRRRRVFVVASARNDFDPAAVLFEFNGVRRDTAPSREAGQDAAKCLTTGTGKRFDWETEDILPVTHSLRGEGFNASEDGTGRVVPLVPVLSDWMSPVAGTLTANTGGLTRPAGNANELDFCVPVAFDTTQITSAANRSNPKPGDPCHPLAAGAHAPAIAFHPTQDPISSTDGTTHAMGCGSSGGTATVAVAVALRGREGGATAELGDEVQNCLRASSGGGDKPHVLAPVAIGWDEELNASTEQSGTLLRGGQGGRHDGVMTPAMQVRRLTPVECERLQGFPDNYTAIPWRNKPADQCPDGPRYKALGNSWAVPVVRWIGARIQAAVMQPAPPSPKQQEKRHEQRQDAAAA